MSRRQSVARSWLLAAGRVMLFLAVLPAALAIAQTGEPGPAGEPGAAAIWAPPSSLPGKLTRAQLRSLPASAFAFPRIRKEPLTDAAHVRSAIARFGQVKNVSDEDRDLAFANIQKAAQYFGVRLRAKDWREFALRH